MSPPPEADDRPAHIGRVACLLVPDLPLRAELRAHPELADVPFVVATGSDPRAEVIEVSPPAFAAGVRSGGSVTHARAVCSELRVRTLSPALERATRQTLLDVALSFAPRAELAVRASGAFSSEAAVLLDASGMGRLYESERHFASALAARAEATGLPGFVALASSRQVARIAARQCAAQARAGRGGSHGSSRDVPPCVLAPGSEEDFLAPLGIDLLDPDDELSQQLSRFGVHCVRDLLRLPLRALARRLGPQVLRLVALARGEEPRTPLSVPVDDRIEEAIDLEFPVDRSEPLLFVLRGQIARLCERLALRHLASGPLVLQLELEGGGRDVRQVGVAAPTLDVRVLLRLLSLCLESQPPGAAVLAVALSTRGVPLRHDQLDLFRPRGPDPNTLARTLSELESLCGAGRVGAPEVADDHRPDAFGLKPFEPRSSDRARRSHRSMEGRSDRGAHSEPLLAVRALRPPVTAEVRMHRGAPTSLRSAVSSGDVVHASGPWRTTGRWWSDTERHAVDHFDVQVSDGTVLRLCFDWHSRSWRVDGVYD